MRCCSKAFVGDHGSSPVAGNDAVCEMKERVSGCSTRTVATPNDRKRLKQLTKVPSRHLLGGS